MMAVKTQEARPVVIGLNCNRAFTSLCGHFIRLTNAAPDRCHEDA
jgi:hypothetical protein